MTPAKLVRIDASTRRLSGGPVVPGGTATRMIGYHGGILSTFVFPPRLEQFDARLRRVADHPIPVALPRGMAIDSLGSLWVADYDAARVWRLDPSDGAPEGPPLAVGHDPTAVAVSSTYVWVANAGDQTVTMFNEADPQLRGVPVPVGASFVPIAASPDGAGNVWVASGTQLLAIVPRS
jgi:sugar lactone lactonase YvrE